MLDALLDALECGDDCALDGHLATGSCLDAPIAQNRGASHTTLLGHAIRRVQPRAVQTLLARGASLQGAYADRAWGLASATSSVLLLEEVACNERLERPGQSMRASFQQLLRALQVCQAIVDATLRPGAASGAQRELLDPGSPKLRLDWWRAACKLMRTGRAFEHDARFKHGCEQLAADLAQGLALLMDQGAHAGLLAGQPRAAPEATMLGKACARLMHQAIVSDSGCWAAWLIERQVHAAIDVHGQECQALELAARCMRPAQYALVRAALVRQAAASSLGAGASSALSSGNRAGVLVV